MSTMLLGGMFTTILVCLIAATTCVTTVAASSRHTSVLDDRKKPHHTEDTQKDDGVTCEHFNEPHVLNVSFLMPDVKIPTNKTTYMCFAVDLPADQDYHFIGVEFELDNYDLVHHMGLQTCDRPLKEFSEPEICNMPMPKGCNYALTFYNKGVKTSCLDPEAGIPFGKGSWSSAFLSIHYTNTDGVEGLRDSSGFKIYYTAKLRRYNAGVFTVGQIRLEIPPGQQDVPQRATCSTTCTRQIFTGPLRVTSAYSHMHYLGKKQNVTLLRPNQPPVVMINEEHFSYTAPNVSTYDPPVTIQPGDKIDMNCHYDSTSRDNITRFGESSFDEMCFVYMTYYPEENVNNKKDFFWQKSCLQDEEKDMCWVVE